MATAPDENVQLNHAPPELHDAPNTKRQRLPDNSPTFCEIGRVLDVEMLLQGILSLLDLASLASFLEVLAVDESWRGILTHEELWKKMLTMHFGGKLPAIEQFNVDEEESDEEVDQEESDEELQDELQDDEEEPDLIAMLEADMDMDDDVSLVGDEEAEDDDPDVVLYDHPPRGPHSTRQTPATVESEAESIPEMRQIEPVTWIEGVPSQMVLEMACPELNEFLRSSEQLVQFDERVQIIRGDIGEIDTIGEQSVDGLAFPTASYLRNPHTGAAAVIFRRAGQDLTDHVRTLDVHLDVGQAHVTPGFDAGVEKLIHCVGPSGFNADCLRDLQRTYRNVLRCIQRENLSCVAMTSISTGNMGLPVDIGSWFALCAIQRFMRSTGFSATIGIVCFEADAYTAFVKSKNNLLSQFNADAVRAVPPLRNR
ncbi:O-acetyl-ADP-ribose deacetylase MACROD2 [Phytophthora citrophthora]|uniref:O-acetyl-ADP-ribose deacetylase MACROD2 n=1 Tax=Phytophthora citrophthora TaxID=4793 RepID=A0AAD9GBS5_9STRA|nr:O-acetyl-ADP-ribose deacetylase MACROD2 [Phytophthora citrophthora]